MKKLVVLVLCVSMVIASLVGCSSGKVKAKVIDIDLTQEEYAYGVDKDQPELLKAVNELIAEIMENGTFDDICNHYFGDGTPVAVESAVQDDSKDQLLVATAASFEPFEYTPDAGAHYYGIDMEIAKLLADKLGKELVICNMAFSSVCISVGEHKVDIAMSGLTVKPDRLNYMDFSTPYYNASQKLIVSEKDKTFDNCKTAADVEAILKNMKQGTVVGCQIGTTGQHYIIGNESFGFAGYSNLQDSGYLNGSLAIQALQNGNFKYVILDSAPAAAITKKLNAELDKTK